MADEGLYDPPSPRHRLQTPLGVREPRRQQDTMHQWPASTQMDIREAFRSPSRPNIAPTAVMTTPLARRDRPGIPTPPTFTPRHEDVRQTEAYRLSLGLRHRGPRQSYAEPEPPEEARKKNEELDRADSDYQSSQAVDEFAVNTPSRKRQELFGNTLFGTPSGSKPRPQPLEELPPQTASTSKRRQEDEIEADVSPTATSSAKKTKRSQTRNVPYDSCTSETQAERDRHIERIEENWRASYQEWMPTGLMPSQSGKPRGKTQKKPLDVHDWNTPLLKELAYLSRVTKGKLCMIYDTLRESISREDRLGGGPQLLVTDVQYVIQMLERDDGEHEDEDMDTSVTVEPAPPSSPPIIGEKEETINVVHRTREDSTHAISAFIDEVPIRSSGTSRPSATTPTAAPANSLPSPRSPNVMDMDDNHDRPIKQEPLSSQTATSASRSFGQDSGGWGGWDEERERLEELRMEWEEKKAERAYHQQLKRVRELTRAHGGSRTDAIRLRGQDEE